MPQTDDVTTEDGARRSAIDVFYETFNGASTDAFDDILTEDWTETPLNAGQDPGRDNYKKAIAMMRKAMPDLRIEPVQVIIGDDMAAVRSKLTASHSAPMYGFAPNGRTYEIMTIDIHRFEGDHIAETWHLEDMAGALHQVGLIGARADEPD